MNKQRQLLKLSRKLGHLDNPAIGALVLSVQEATDHALSALAVTEAACATLRKAVTLEDGYRVGLDHSDFVAGAAKASAALTRMAADFNSLAIALQAEGEDISY